MKITRKTTMQLFILTLLLFFISLTLKDSITGFAIFEPNIISYSLNDYTIMILFVTTIMSLFFMRYTSIIQKKLEYDLYRFKVYPPNIAWPNLQKYLKYWSKQNCHRRGKYSFC